MHDVVTGDRLVDTGDARWEMPSSRGRAGPLIAIPLYRTPELIDGLSVALAAMADEINAIDASVLLIDDSPDDIPLRLALDRVVPRLAALFPVELVHNPGNLGFVRSANVALGRGLADSRDVLLLNSDALPRPGAFAEMVAAAVLDPMISVVSPRSDNATICNSPYPDPIRTTNPERAYAGHRAIQLYLPRVSYVPTAVGFCLLIRHAMLAEFGVFDEMYGGGYEEENDFIRRCNRRGYRAVLANRAYVHHLGKASFANAPLTTSLRKERNRALVTERYPELDLILTRWYDDTEYRAEHLLAGLVPDEDGRQRLLFDCATLGCFFNGTHEHICALLAAFAARHSERYAITVLCEPEAFAFHGLDRVAGLVRCDLADMLARPAAMVMRLGQPFDQDSLHALAAAAPVAGVLMFDTIALDCQHLDVTDLQTLWQVMIEDIDAVGFNSGFSRDQFARRFDIPGRIVEFVSRCSTDVDDYGPRRAAGDGAGGILLVGNHYPHKHVADTLAALRAAGTDRPITVFGVAVEPAAGVESFVAGDLPQEQVDGFYDAAGVVLFPSHYEGFGLPILHALARRRPVIARDLPCAREIHAACRERANLHLVGSTAEMVRLALDPPRWVEPGEDDVGTDGDWGAAADAVADAVAAAIAGFDFATLRRRQARAISRVRAADAFAAAAAKGAARRGALSLPPIGHGFRLAEEVDRALSQSGLPRAHDPGAVGFDLACEDEDAMQAVVRDMLATFRTLAPETTVSLTLRSADPGADATAMAILIGCGCDDVGVEAIEGGVVARGVYRAAWTFLLPGVEDDADFVYSIYRQTLGRNPDTDGGRTYFEALQDGLSREDLVRLFLWSGERREAIVRRIAQHQRPDARG